MVNINIIQSFNYTVLRKSFSNILFRSVRYHDLGGMVLTICL